MPELKPLDSFRLDGKVAIVTGASSGLGDRFARVLGSVGASVVVAARRVERLEKLAADLPKALAVECDITAPGAPNELVERTIEHFGAVDVVVNNAGMARDVPAVDYPVEQFREEVELNLVAPYELARRAAAWMIEHGRGGTIVNVGSISGEVGSGRQRLPGYTAAKGGLHNLTRELASQWARKGIRVNAVAPAYFETEMTSEGMFRTEAGRALIDERTPMGRPGQEGELDGALLFLASDASSYVTGHVLMVDGGWTAI